MSRYFVELLRHLPRLEDPVEIAAPFRRIANRHALEAFPQSRLRPLTGPFQPYPDLAAALLRPARRSTVDLVHHTFYHPRFLRDYPGVPKIVTIYDMIPEIVGAPGRFGNPHLAKRKYVERADLLLFISGSARDDLTAAYGAPSVPSVVTHLGVDARFHEGGARLTGIPWEYVLFVGNRAGYKDFTTVIRAFGEARRELEEMHLLCVGGGPLSATEREALEQAGLLDRTHQRSLPDLEMPGAYANAAAFVFPSRYEGFGLPVLEAMAAGTPAILARTSSLPEVGGDAALYFSPGDPAELAETLSGLLGDQQGRAELVRRGRTRAKRFTWSRTAEVTATAYRTVLG